MDHAYFIEKISAYFDRDLDPYELRVVEEHLETCQECRELFKRLEKLDTFVEENSSLADDEYWERSARKIEAALEPTASSKTTDIRPKAWKSLGWKLTAVAASIATLAFIGLHKTDLFDKIRDDNLQTAPSAISKPTELKKITNSGQLPGREKKEFHIPKPVVEKERKTESIKSVPAPPAKRSSAQAVQSSKKMDNAGRDKADAILSNKDNNAGSMDLLEETPPSAPASNVEKLAPLSSENQPEGRTKGTANFAASNSPSLTGAAEPGLEQRSLLHQRDSLISSFRMGSLNSTGKTVENLPRGMATKSVAEKPDRDRITSVLKLLEIQYLIGKSTLDRSTYDSVLVFLDSLENHSDSAISDQAANYFKLLKKRNGW